MIPTLDTAIAQVRNAATATALTVSHDLVHEAPDDGCDVFAAELGHPVTDPGSVYVELMHRFPMIGPELREGI